MFQAWERSKSLLLEDVKKLLESNKTSIEEAARLGAQFASTYSPSRNQKQPRSSDEAADPDETENGISIATIGRPLLLFKIV